jgi:ribosomal protein S8
MVNWKSKYLEMKLKYINAKQKGGQFIEITTPSGAVLQVKELTQEMIQLKEKNNELNITLKSPNISNKGDTLSSKISISNSAIHRIFTIDEKNGKQYVTKRRLKQVKAGFNIIKKLYEDMANSISFFKTENNESVPRSVVFHEINDDNVYYESRIHKNRFDPLFLDLAPLYALGEYQRDMKDKYDSFRCSFLREHSFIHIEKILNVIKYVSIINDSPINWFEDDIVKLIRDTIEVCLKTVGYRCMGSLYIFCKEICDFINSYIQVEGYIKIFCRNNDDHGCGRVSMVIYPPKNNTSIVIFNNENRTDMPVSDINQQNNIHDWKELNNNWFNKPANIF